MRLRGAHDPGTKTRSSGCMAIMLTKGGHRGSAGLDDEMRGFVLAGRAGCTAHADGPGVGDLQGGRLTSWRRRQLFGGKNAGFPDGRERWQLTGRNTAPPPVEKHPRSPRPVNSSMTDSSTSQLASPSRSKWMARPGALRDVVGVESRASAARRGLATYCGLSRPGGQLMQ
jgi:hypothetical protein